MDCLRLVVFSVLISVPSGALLMMALDHYLYWREKHDH